MILGCCATHLIMVILCTFYIINDNKIENALFKVRLTFRLNCQKMK
jgi:hypothetical protein